MDYHNVLFSIVKGGVSMATRSKGRTPVSTGNLPPEAGSPSERVLIVVAKRELGLRATAEGVVTVTGVDISSLTDLLDTEGLTLEPLFGISEDRLEAQIASVAAKTGEEVPDLSVYYRLALPEGQAEEQAEALAERVRQQEAIDGAYFQPPASLPVEAVVGEVAPEPSLPVTPNFTNQQGYLDPAPGGIDAEYAWTLSGGRGAGVRIIDIEGAWRFSHEDLSQNQGGLIGGVHRPDVDWRNHGTAVIGEIGGDVNSIGITGICPDANVRAVSVYRDASLTYNLPAALRQAADSLGPGDIILIEQQYRHPSRGWTTVEWWPAEFDAIRYAVSKGVLVVEAAGNGGNNLDDGIYNTPLTGFPSGWTNPFNRSNRDSGAIVVGAGAPPPNTHGRNHGPDRSRLGFSNYGSMVDVQGWGEEVTSCGYGSLQGGANEDLWYTDTFNGTSSASPIVVGVLGCVLGVLRSRGRIPLSPARARELLRATGSPQQDAPGRPSTQRIGNRPNLRQLIARALETRTWVGVQFTGTIPANQTHRWFTFNWPAYWHVVWTVVPTSARPGGPQIEWKVQVERASDQYITYWISITNLTPVPVNIEARYAVLGW
jgi:hypothetical protein